MLNHDFLSGNLFAYNLAVGYKGRTHRFTQRGARGPLAQREPPHMNLNAPCFILKLQKYAFKYNRLQYLKREYLRSDMSLPYPGTQKFRNARVRSFILLFFLWHHSKLSQKVSQFFKRLYSN